MSRPILVDPNGGPLEIIGDIMQPGQAPLKIDVWRYVRHPPPDLAHVRTIKDLRGRARDVYPAGEPDELLGKVVSWVWVCSHLPPDAGGWRVRLDVRQDGESAPGYPIEYAGPLPGGQPLAELRISEPVRAR